MTTIASRMSRVEMSGIRKIFDLVQSMPDAVDLSIGQADFDPPPVVREAVTRAMNAGHNRYGVTQGIPALHERLRPELERAHGWKGDATLITSGCTGSLFLALMVLVEEGDEVLLPDPCFALYGHLVRVCGGEPVLVDTCPDFRMTAGRIAPLITHRSKLLIVNSPANPTGVALSSGELADIGTLAGKHGLAVISDEIYEAFAYDEPHQGMAPHFPDTILVGGFSKTYGVPGWRLGYAAGPKEIIQQMTTFQQFSFVCANVPAQHAALEMLDVDMSPWIEPYRSKRDLLWEGLKDLYEVVRPGGAFYVFPKCPEGKSASTFVPEVIRSGVLVVPGGAFSARDTHFRVSFAAEEETLRKGIDLLRKAAGK